MKGRAIAALMVVGVSASFMGCGRSAADPEVGVRRDERAITEVGLRDKFKKRPKHDETSIRQLLEENGASKGEAERIVQLLSRRLTPAEMHVWLSHPEKSHGVPDPELTKKFEEAGLVPVVGNWTPVNGISAGKTELVIEEAERFSADG